GTPGCRCAECTRGFPAPRNRSRQTPARWKGPSERRNPRAGRGGWRRGCRRHYRRLGCAGGPSTFPREFSLWRFPYRTKWSSRRPPCLATQHSGNHPPNHIAQTNDEAADYDSQRHVALVEQVIEIELGCQLIERDVAHDNEQDRHNAKGNRRDEV